MKIIFDSEEQKANFIDLIKCYCPGELDENMRYVDDEECKTIPNCSKCWENCGIEMEVKEDE